jgi:hypothetical protein
MWKYFMVDQRLSGKQKTKRFINGTGLEWTTVTSGIPQGSVPGSIFFFTIYINDLPDVVQNIANLFLDDTKVYAIVNKEEEQHSLQNEKTTECIGQISGS